MELQRNKTIEKIIGSHFLQQLIFCIIYFLLLILDDLFDGDLNAGLMIQMIAFFIFGIILMEFNLQYLIPKFLVKNRIGKYFLVFLVILFTYTALLVVSESYVLKRSIIEQESTEAFYYIIIQYTILCAISMLYHFNFKYITANRKLFQLQTIQKEQKEAELMALKSQINPHFLFNTLNNIYSFSVTRKPNTPDLILKLSELTSYVLYDSDKETVSINDEIDFIRNFIELEKIRVDDSVDITFDVVLNNTNIQVAPLLFIPLVENVFNHGLHRQTENDYAKIKLYTSTNKLEFSTTNTFSGEIEKSKKNKNGIGLKNLKKRLELIYPEHELFVSSEGNVYNVEMSIELKI